VWSSVKFRVGLRLVVVVLVVVQLECGSGSVIVQVDGIGLGTGPPARTVMGFARASSGRRVWRRVVRCILESLFAR
jgi:hypothetical protein